MLNPRAGLEKDGGSIRALSQLIILQEFMQRIQMDQKLDEVPLVCEHFEIIGGTGSGAYVPSLTPITFLYPTHVTIH